MNGGAGPIVARRCTEPAQWDPFVEQVPWATPQHAFGYGRALTSSFPYLRLQYRQFQAAGRTIAALPLVDFSAGGPFRAICSLVFDMYGGPLIHSGALRDDELATTISRHIDLEAKRHGAFEARFMLPPATPEEALRCLQRSARVETWRRECPLLALDRPLEDVRRAYLPAVRRAIARSRAAGVVVRAEAGVDELRRAYPVYRARMRTLRATPKPWRFVEALVRDGLAVPFVALRDDNVVGLLVLLVSSRMAMYWMSGMEPATTALRPMNALLDAAIAWAHGRGIARFSLGESHGGRPGLVRFKKGWGPETAWSTTVVRIYRPGIRRAWWMLEPVARRAYALWDRAMEAGRRASRRP